MKYVLIAACLLLGACGWRATSSLVILRSDDDGMIIRAGLDTNPDQLATTHCQSLGRLMQPIRQEAYGTHEMVHYYSCL